ncbi:MAG TPA: tRNA (adenosine(37)-N6)-threonylcarbamoyltransferase complex ATPase subunit type 1 TsaE [Acidobacteriota bacterium]|nr:tRNA (adenosine(37)-N6)-threonylcarbamoyltransferase complex ATPase subunit type 1 TsaE [Acidobacteriota bacterium]
MEIFHSFSEDETQTLGRKVATALPRPSIVLLYGDLGAGKTVLTRGLAEGLGLEDPSLVHSPTFSLVHEYPGRDGPIYHVDLYRLDTVQDLYSIGLDELLDGHHTVIIEWAEKLKLPVDRAIRITLTVGQAPEHREIQVEWAE